MPAGEVRVEGLRELQRAFKAADRTLARDLREGLRNVADPVRATATQLALQNITRIGIPWSEMRIGVTSTTVYVAPKRRGTRDPRKRRPNLALLLLGRSMLPAVEQNQQVIEAGFDRLLDDVENAFGRAP